MLTGQGLLGSLHDCSDRPDTGMNKDVGSRVFMHAMAPGTIKKPHGELPPAGHTPDALPCLFRMISFTVSVRASHVN